MFGCSNNTLKVSGKKQGLSFFTFPKDEHQRNIWITKCRRASFGSSLNYNNQRICSAHFDESCFEVDLKSMFSLTPSRKKLKTGSLPSLNLPLSSSSTKTAAQASRAKRTQKRNVNADLRAELHVKRHRSEPCPVPEVSSELENLKSTVKCQASEIRALRRQVSPLQKALRLQRLSTKQQTSAHLKKYFTAGQVRCSMKMKTRTRWSDEDIRSALTLRCISSKAYKYLRELREYPLPSISTLQRRVMSVSCEPGLMESALALLAQRVKFLNADEKSVVLCVDEMSVSSGSTMIELLIRFLVRAKTCVFSWHGDCLLLGNSLYIMILMSL